jgi:hypothetical protein
VGKGDHATIDVVRDGKSRTIDVALTDNALVAPASLPPWLGNWMKSFAPPNMFELDGPPWSDWLKPLDPAKPETHATEVSSWLERLRELFAPTNGSACQRS